MDETLRRVPGIGDIPILGYLFRSQAYKKNTTELVVMITPHILRRDSPGVTPNLPGLVEPFLPAPTRTIPMPPPRVHGPDTGFTGGPARTVVSNTSASAPASQIATVARRSQTAIAPSAASQPAHLSTRTELRRIAKRRNARRTKSPGSSASRRSETARLPKSRPRARPRKSRSRRKSSRSRARPTWCAKQREKKLEEKRLEEQAAIDRKRWIEQQEQAAKAKVVADKLAKEQARRDAEQQKIENARLEEERRVAEKHQKAQDKLAREQASRNGELEKLITQYKRLTGEQP